MECLSPTVSNPLVVFFKESEIPASSICDSLPVAFNEQGKHFDPQSNDEKALLIILSEDRDDTPGLQHTNKDETADLRVIWHKMNDDKEEGLRKYGNPIKVAEFSHSKGNAIYESLVQILMGTIDVCKFVNHWQKTGDLTLLDELAAVVLLMSLADENSTEYKYAYKRYTELLGCCDPGLIKSIASCKDKLEAVQAIEAHADTMLAEAS